jgi:hypothetical protein
MPDMNKTSSVTGQRSSLPHPAPRAQLHQLVSIESPAPVTHDRGSSRKIRHPQSFQHGLAWKASIDHVSLNPPSGFSKSTLHAYPSGTTRDDSCHAAMPVVSED